MHAWNTNTKFPFWGFVCRFFRCISTVRFRECIQKSSQIGLSSNSHQPSAPGNLTPPRIPRDFWSIPGHTGRAEAPCKGKKTGKTVKPSHFPAVQPSCNHHIHHSNWHNWSKNSNMFDKFAFFPSLWPTMMRYSMQVRPSSPWPCRACPTWKGSHKHSNAYRQLWHHPSAKTPWPVKRVVFQLKFG